MLRPDARIVDKVILPNATVQDSLLGTLIDADVRR
jgi:hypothetical protein